MPGILKQEEHLHRHSHSHRAGINQTFDPNINGRPSSISCWFVISLLCKVCSFFLLFKQDSPCWENDCEGNTNQEKSVWSTSSIFHSCPLYSSPLISSFIIVTLYSKTLPHSDSCSPAISSSLSLILPISAIVLPLNSVGTHRVKCIHGTCGWLPQYRIRKLSILRLKCCWPSVWFIFLKWFSDM